MTIGYDGETPRSTETVVLSTQHHATWPVRSSTRSSGSPSSTRSSRSMRPASTPPAPVSTSTPPAPSSSGDPVRTRSLHRPEDHRYLRRHGLATAVAPSPARIPPRWTARPPTRCGGLLRTVAAGPAARCEVQVAYGIGIAHPVGLHVETFGTHTVDPTGSPPPSARSSTCGPPRSSTTSTSCGRSTGPPPPTVTSGASCRHSRGNPQGAPRHCGMRAGRDSKA